MRRITLSLLAFIAIQATTYASTIDMLIQDSNENGELTELLDELASNPVNVNTADRALLESLPFLNSKQIENLLEYVYDYGALKSIYELRLIDGFDEETLELCHTFMYAGEAETEKTTAKDVFTKGKHNIVSKCATKLPQKNENYLGSPYSAYLKYRYLHDNLSYGVTMEKDIGEPFDLKYNKGFDFYSGHLAVSNIGVLKNFVIGDFKAAFGQGMVMRTTNSYSTYDATLVSLNQNSVSPYTACTENSYLRGVATTLSFRKKYDLTLLCSHTQYSKSENYHRTEGEFKKKNNNPVYLAGGNLNASFRKFRIGISALYEIKSRKFNAGIDFRARIYKFDISGEISMNEKKAVGNILTLNYYATSNVAVTLMHRYYSSEFSSVKGNSYSSNKMNDENGMIVGFTMNPTRKTKISLLADAYRYGRDTGGYVYSKFSYIPADNHMIMVTYRYKYKETSLHSTRISYTGTFSSITLKSGVYMNHSSNKSGYLLSQEIIYKPEKPALRINMLMSLFDIPDYSNRIYLYESDLPMSYCSNMYYRKGYRAMICIGYDWRKKIGVCIKAAHTYYINFQGSTDIKAMVYLKL